MPFQAKAKWYSDGAKDPLFASPRIERMDPSDAGSTICKVSTACFSEPSFGGSRECRAILFLQERFGSLRSGMVSVLIVLDHPMGRGQPLLTIPTRESDQSDHRLLLILCLRQSFLRQ